jgi:hypothetical protein
MHYSPIPASDITVTWTTEPSALVTVYFGNVELIGDDGTSLGKFVDHPEWFANPVNESFSVIWGSTYFDSSSVKHSDILVPQTHEYRSPGNYTIETSWLGVRVVYPSDENGWVREDNHQGPTTGTVDLVGYSEWSKGWQPITVAQPKIGGNDGYGAIAGASTRRDYTESLDPSWDGETYPLPMIDVPAVQQLNTNAAYTGVYGPRDTVTAGTRRRIRATVNWSGNLAAGTPLLRASAQFFNSSGTYLGQVDGAWVRGDDLNSDNDMGIDLWSRIEGEFTAPANATRMTPVFEMQHPNPANAFAVWNVRYYKFVV